MKRKGLLSAAVALSSLAMAQSAEDGLRALDFDKYEYARNVFTKLTQSEPTKGSHYFYLGQAYLNLFKPDSALWAYNRGVQAAPNDFINYVGLGELKLADNKTDEARQYFDKALSFSKGRDGLAKDVNALRLTAVAMIAPEENKMINEAHQNITRALEIDKGNYNALVTAGDVSLLKNPGQAGEAADLYEKAISINSKNPKAYTRISDIWLSVKNAEATNDALKRALEIDPNYAPALKNLAEYYLRTRQFAKAKETYLKYLDNSEPSIGNKTRYAKILFRNKEYEECVTQINDILSADANADLYLYRLLGYSSYEVGESTKDTSFYRPGVNALEYFLSKIDEKKIIPDDYEYLGKLYLRLGEDDLAIQKINTALEKSPNNSSLLKEVGNISYKLRKFDDAINYLERFITSGSKVSLVDYQILGLAAYYGKQYPKADSAFAKILELKPDYIDGYYWRGTINSGMDTEAKDTVARFYFQQYITLAEPTPEKYKARLITSYNYLSVYYIKNDDNKTALSFVDKVLALEPENATAKERKKLLTAPAPKATPKKK